MFFTISFTCNLKITYVNVISGCNAFLFRQIFNWSGCVIQWLYLYYWKQSQIKISKNIVVISITVLSLSKLGYLKTGCINKYILQVYNSTWFSWKQCFYHFEAFPEFIIIIRWLWLSLQWPFRYHCFGNMYFHWNIIFDYKTLKVNTALPVTYFPDSNVTHGKQTLINEDLCRTLAQKELNWVSRY